jgi:hypothetical protein
MNGNPMTAVTAALGRIERHRVARRLDWIVGAILFILSFAVFQSASVQQAGDSKYTMLLAENVLRHGDFTLERYHLPASDYRIQTVGDHEYYYFPPGTSILSIPFVALMHLRGISAVGPDGAYNVNGELTLDAELADLVMALFAVIVYITARLALPVLWSVAVTLVSVFGTQVFSTLSRSMWSDTCSTVLLGFACFLLLRSESRRERVNLPVVASLEGFAYIVRPTGALVIVGTTAYVVWKYRRHTWIFLLVLAGWLCLFLGYSWYHFHELLPDYYAANRLQFTAPLSALSGNLISPSRGLLVYVPAFIAVLILLWRHRDTIRFPALVGLAIFVVISHLVMLSGFSHWWGGHSYGARLNASLVPWFVVLAIITVDAWRPALASSARPLDFVLATAVGVLCAASIAVNGVGAYSEEAQTWNFAPDDIDRAPSRLWSWRSPQFLAPFLEPGGPYLPLPPDGLFVGTGQADRYLGRGWPWGEGEFRWTEGRDGSTVRLALSDAAPGVLELTLRPYLADHKVTQQRLIVSMNGHDLGTVVLRSAEFATLSFVVPAGVAKPESTLRLWTPDAASPSAVEGSPDRRELGVAVRVIRWRDGPS